MGVQKTKVIVAYVDVAHLIVLVKPFVWSFPYFTRERSGFAKAVGLDDIERKGLLSRMVVSGRHSEGR